MSSQGFEDRAADWIRFARAERHDAYWAYRHAFFEILLRPAGEGARDRVRRGPGLPRPPFPRIRRHRADLAPTLVEAARDADPRGTYVVGDAAALPFDDGLFDLVVSYNSLIDVEDMPAAVAEAGRVLRPGGCFCGCVPHPFSEAGEFESGADDAAFVVQGSYLAEADYELLSDRNGIAFRFASRRFPLESYSRAHEAAGLAIEALREPPLPGVQSHRRMRMPLFLMWRAVKVADRG